MTVMPEMVPSPSDELSELKARLHSAEEELAEESNRRTRAEEELKQARESNRDKISGQTSAIMLSRDRIARELHATRLTQLELRRSESFLHTVFENAPVAIGIERNGIGIYGNPAYMRLFGYSDEKELIGKPIINYFAPHFRKLIAERACRREQGLYVPDEYDAIGLRADGTEFDLHLAGTKVELADGPAVVAFLWDITERKQAERKLHEHELLLEQIIEILPIGLWQVDRSGNILKGNSAGRSIWGGEKLIGAKDYENYHAWWADSGKPIKPHEWAVCRAVTQGEISLNEEIIIEALDNKRKYILNSAIPIRNVKQEIVGAIATNQDITERKRAEFALRESEQTMRYIIKYDPNDIAVFDTQMRYIAVSDRFLSDYSIPTQNIVGLCHYEVFPEIPERWKNIHQRGLKGEIIRNDDDSFVRQDGSTTYVRWECRPWYTIENTIGGIIMYTEVTTERKVAELALAAEKQRLQHANRQLDAANRRLMQLDETKNRFVSMVAHELRTPLASIIGFAQTLIASGDREQKSERERYLSIIESEAQRLNRLINDILDLSKIESGDIDQVHQMFSMTDLLRETIDSVLLPAHLQVFFDQTGRPSPVVRAARERIRQVFRNLLDNAVNYTGPGGSIRVIVEGRESEVMVCIRDTGQGIKADDLPHIFERFHRGSSRHKQQTQGSGLGLSIAKEIIESHGGKIWAESSEGVGSSFYFTLPIYKD